MVKQLIWELPLTAQRFASLYAYDKKIFQKRFLGEQGVAWLQHATHIHACYAHVLTIWHVLTYFVMLFLGRSQELEQFWERNRDTRFFRNHPVLSREEFWLRISCCNFFINKC